MSSITSVRTDPPVLLQRYKLCGRKTMAYQVEQAVKKRINSKQCNAMSSLDTTGPTSSYTSTRYIKERSVVRRPTENVNRERLRAVDHDALNSNSVPGTYQYQSSVPGTARVLHLLYQ